MNRLMAKNGRSEAEYSGSLVRPRRIKRRTLELVSGKSGGIFFEHLHI